MMEKRGKRLMKLLGTMAAFVLFAGTMPLAVAAEETVPEEETVLGENDGEIVPEVSDGETVPEKDIVSEQEVDLSIMEAILNDDIDTLTARVGGVIAYGVSRNITWLIDGGGKLIVSGTGDYERVYDILWGQPVEVWALQSPWGKYSEHIISAEINVSGMTDASKMFFNCRNLVSIDVNNFDISNVTNMSNMFDRCSNLTNLDVSNWDTSSVTNMSDMFCFCNSLANLDVSNFNTSNVTDMSGMFLGCSSLINLDVSNFDTKNVTNMLSMFWDCNNLTNVDVSDWDTSNVINMGLNTDGMFSGCSSLINLDVSNWNTSKVTAMGSIFSECSSLINLDVSNWDTSNVTEMYGMFDGCSNLTSLNVGNFDTKNVIDMEFMFSGCNSLLSLDVSNWNTGNVEDMRGMFGSCSRLASLDVSNWDTGNVMNMGWMFSNCSSLTSLDVSNWDTKKVGDLDDMSCMFSGCSSLTYLDVSNWETGNVAFMDSMFSGCSNLTSLDVSNWDTKSVGNMEEMFSGCSSLTSLDLSNWDTSSINYKYGDFTNPGSSFRGMFSGCINLVDLNISNFDMSNLEPGGSNGMFDGCNALKILHTPKLVSEAVSLPAIYSDPHGNQTTELTATYTNTILTRTGIRPTPEPPQPTPGNYPPAGYNGWWTADGLEYWYENGIKQGTEGRGKEIYDPVTNAWYWLDAISGGAKAVNKDVYQESDGGKWVRYDENGAMVKGEDYCDGAWYYFEPVTGTMMKGPVILEDGRRVFYDTVSGKMLKGHHIINNQRYWFDEKDGHFLMGQTDRFWVHIDGKDFWYEDWQRQGWNPADPSYRGKEICVPVTNAWYWLDNMYQGAKAVNKDVYQESRSAYPDRPDGTGKWVRYDANGQMVKGWQTTAAGTYYFEPVTGSMAKGYVTIDGKTYYFDVTTGIRK